jgi:beta-lysine 5,6-aminomutase beta subunit
MSPMSALLKIFQKKAPAPEAARQGALLSQVDLKRVMPYGDMLGDGAIQLSFTLPVESSPEAKEAAKHYAEKLGLKNVLVASMESIGRGFSYFVVYARSAQTIDFTHVKVPKAEFKIMEREEIIDFVKREIGKRLVIIGATTGTDAHTVGIDAIMNMKGYQGDYGLESYPCFQAINLRSQVGNEELVRQAVRLRADVILVSKIVTQRGKHLEELKELGKLLKSNKELRTPLIKIVGGPRMSHAEAVKLGYDAGFGPGTLPSEVASYLVQEYARKSKKG